MNSMSLNPRFKEGKRPIIKRQLGHKHQKMVYATPGDPHPTKNIQTTQEEMRTFSITDADILTLARYAIKIEEHYTKEAGEYRPMDMEWSKDGESGEIFIVQARPETVQSQKDQKWLCAKIKRNSASKDRSAEREVILTGRAIGGKLDTERADYQRFRAYQYL